MARLIDPSSGSTVDVEDDFAERLVASFGYTPAEEPTTKKAPAKKAASGKSND